MMIEQIGIIIIFENVSGGAIRIKLRIDHVKRKTKEQLN
jgi:hypothetical protein